MAKAYGGKPPERLDKKKSKRKQKKKSKIDLLAELDQNSEEGDDEEEAGEKTPPLTDRLFPSLMHGEDERVRKMAKVAYR
jgi:hypothetical protein